MEISFGNDTVYADYIKYNAQKGRLYKKDNTEIALPFSFIADLDAIKTGWLEFPTGGAPSFIWDAIAFVAGPRPSPKHNRGFGLTISNRPICGGIVEWNNSSKLVCAAMLELIKNYRAIKGNFQGKLPVVTISGNREHKADIPARNGLPAVKATNYSPVIDITEWVQPGAFDKNNVVQMPVVSSQGAALAVATAVSEF